MFSVPTKILLQSRIALESVTDTKTFPESVTDTKTIGIEE